MKKITLLISTVITLLPLCSLLFAKPPEWVDKPSKRYPGSLYLVGVGEASSREEAQDKALASLAKIFHAQVSQKTSEWEKYLQVSSRGASQTEQKKLIEQVTNVSTAKVLEGARIAEMAQDEGTFYALAVIDRAERAAALFDKIKELNAKINVWLNLGQTSRAKLEKIRQYKRAINALILRDAYQSDLRIVSVNGVVLSPRHSAPEVVSEYEMWLSKNFSVEVQIEGDEGEQVRKAITQRLVEEGFPVQGEGTTEQDLLGEQGGAIQSDLLAQGAVTLSPMALSDPSVSYVRWCVDIELIEPATHRIIGVVAASGREGHVSIPEAKIRALRTLVPQVVSEIGARLNEYLDGEFTPHSARASTCTGELSAPSIPPAPSTMTSLSAPGAPTPLPKMIAPKSARLLPGSGPAGRDSLQDCWLAETVNMETETVEPVDPTTQFPQTTGPIHLVCNLNEQGVRFFYVRLIAEDVAGIKAGRLLERNYVKLNEDSAVGHYEFASPGKGWAAGTYRLDLYASNDCGSVNACTTETNKAGTLYFQVMASP